MRIATNSAPPIGGSTQMPRACRDSGAMSPKPVVVSVVRLKYSAS